VGLPITNGFGVSGTLLGVTLGCNYQLANFVFGVEGDPSWANVTATVRNQPPFSPNRLSSTTEESLSTFRARAGVAWNRFLFYGTGGAAFAGVNVNVCATLANACVANSQLLTGWVAGGGVEYMFLTNWIGRVEYLYEHFGDFTVPTGLVPPGSPPRPGNLDLSAVQKVRVGISYKFGP